jgi:hypothetical protein
MPCGLPVPLPCSTGRYRENVDFMPKIEEIATCDGLQIKDLPD